MSKSPKPQSLETYLARIAHELRDLPSQARADEMREIEAHLRALVLASQQLENLSQAQATEVGLRQFGSPRAIGRKLRKAWERKQPEAWWRAVVAPIAGMMSFLLSALVYNRILDSLGDIVNRDWSTPMYFCFSLFVLVMFFFPGFTAGVVSPKRGVLLTLAYSAYSAYVLLTLSPALDRANVPGENTISVVSIYLVFGLLGSISACVGTYFGAHRSRKLVAIAGFGGNKFLAHIAASRKFLARIAGDSKLNVQL